MAVAEAETIEINHPEWTEFGILVITQKHEIPLPNAELRESLPAKIMGPLAGCVPCCR